MEWGKGRNKEGIYRGSLSNRHSMQGNVEERGAEVGRETSQIYPPGACCYQRGVMCGVISGLSNVTRKGSARVRLASVQRGRRGLLSSGKLDRVSVEILVDLLNGFDAALSNAGTARLLNSGLCLLPLAIILFVLDSICDSDANTALVVWSLALFS